MKALTASMLSIGLHALRKANTFQTGLFYQAFLSIGIERLLKIIIITQYRCDNEGEFPVNQQLRKYGHDLLKMFEIVDVQNLQEINNEIISFLSEFAKSSRYYNINVMVESKTRNNDPLGEWQEIQDKILQNCGRKIIQTKKFLQVLLMK